MTQKKFKISLRAIVLVTLLFVGIVPLLVAGWYLADSSGMELRAAEGRYQTQLVQDKARQIEMFGKGAIELVSSYSNAFEIADDLSVISSEQTQKKLGESLKENPNLLALSVKPLQGESLSAFRNEVISNGEIDQFSQEVLGRIDQKELAIGQPQMIEKSGEVVFSVASPVYMQGELKAAVVAIISLNGVSQIIAEKPMNEGELWELGLPIVFVVDEKGRPIFHPNSANVTSRKPLMDLKIVQEWTATNDQIQSALLPFVANYDGTAHDMIGAYSTASFNNQMKFGVIVMQDASKSLAIVNQMYKQVWLLSFAVVLVILFLGFVLARQITSPLSNLVKAAKTIASGDLSHRIKTRRISEIGTLGEAFNSMSDDLEAHIANLANAAEENRQLFIGTVKALAAAIDGKDRYTRGHSERVSRVSVAIGQRLGMDEDELEKLRISALLHDVGKIAIDDSILKKPAALTDEEYEIMKSHPKAGYKIMKNIPAMKDFLPGMYMHHEMVNGKGYPQGLSDEEIPLQAKIVSVADTFDAMTIDRPYQKGMELGAAIERIKEFVGTRYDIKVVDALIRACADGQIGVGRVKLKNFKPNQKSKPNPRSKPKPKPQIQAKPKPQNTSEVESPAAVVQAEIKEQINSSSESEIDFEKSITTLGKPPTIEENQADNSENSQSEVVQINETNIEAKVDMNEPEQFQETELMELLFDSNEGEEPQKSEEESIELTEEEIYDAVWKIDENQITKRTV